jgi:hypothetical protein
VFKPCVQPTTGLTDSLRHDHGRFSRHSSNLFFTQNSRRLFCLASFVLFSAILHRSWSFFQFINWQNPCPLSYSERLRRRGQLERKNHPVNRLPNRTRDLTRSSLHSSILAPYTLPRLSLTPNTHTTPLPWLVLEQMVHRAGPQPGLRLPQEGEWQKGDRALQKLIWMAILTWMPSVNEPQKLQPWQQKEDLKQEQRGLLQGETLEAFRRQLRVC